MTTSTFSDFAKFSSNHTSRFAHRMPASQVSTLVLVLTADTLAMRSASRASRASRLEGHLWGASWLGSAVAVMGLALTLAGVL